MSDLNKKIRENFENKHFTFVNILGDTIIK